MKQITIDVSKFFTRIEDNSKIKLSIGCDQSGRLMYSMAFKNNEVVKQFVKFLIDIIWRTNVNTKRKNTK